MYKCIYYRQSSCTWGKIIIHKNVYFIIYAHIAAHTGACLCVYSDLVRVNI